MEKVSIHEARVRLLRMLDTATGDEEIVIAKAGTPVAQFVLSGSMKGGARRFGGLKGKVRIADDFDAPLPSDVIAAFEGK